jgi:hypothetical protein
MTESFQAVFGFVAAFVLGIVILAMFFQGLAMLNRRLGPSASVKFREVLKQESWINVHLAGGRVLERVQFLGFTDGYSVKGGNVPYHLANMIILRTDKGTRILLRADSVKMLEELSPSQQ